MHLDIRYPAAVAALERLHFHTEVGESNARANGELHGHVLVACASELRSSHTVRPRSVAREDLDERVHKPDARRGRCTSTRRAAWRQVTRDDCHCQPTEHDFPQEELARRAPIEFARSASSPPVQTWQGAFCTLRAGFSRINRFTPWVCNAPLSWHKY